MALKTIRIGSMTDVHQYDDGSIDEAIETEQPIKAAAGVNPDHVIILSQLPSLTNYIQSDAVIADNKAVRGDGGARKLQDSDVTIKDGGDVSIPTGKGYQVNDIQVLTDQQAAEADLAVVPDLTGTDTIDQAGLESYLGDIKTKIDNLLAKLRTHGLIDT